MCCVVSVALRCVVIHYAVLRCVAIRCVVSVLLHCVVLYLLSCIPLCWVVLRCLVLCCVVDKFSISSIPSVLKLCISRHTQPTSLTGRQSLHQRTRQITQPPLPNRKTQHLSLTLRQYEPHYATNSTNSATLTYWQKKPHLNTTRQTK